MVHSAWTRYTIDINTGNTMTPVLQRTNLLTVALLEDYKNYSIRSHQRSMVKDGDPVGYHQKSIEELKANKVDYSFEIEEGRRYYKIVMVNNQRSVHAFVDKKTGDVYKPASWKSPAKYVRYNLLDADSCDECLKRADWSGGYLYMA